jgi:hypothetical protein
MVVALLAVIAVGVAVALPSFMGQKKAKVSSVKANAHSLQLCLESYTTDSGGQYPEHLKDVFKYYPGRGSGWTEFAPGQYRCSSQILVDGGSISADQLERLVSSSPGAPHPDYPPMAVEYFCVRDSKHHGYAIVLTDEQGNLVGDRNLGALVMSSY